MACQKDKLETEIKKEVPKALLSATTREGNPFTDSRIHLVDGMLKFDDYKAFNDTHEALKELSSNAELNHATLIEMGYNPNTDLDDELAVIPSHPVLQAFAHSFGLRSEEQKEEVAFKAHLQTDAEIEDFRGSPVYSPELQAMLNDNREVGIGNFIVKFITENKIALIYNRDLTVLEQVRSTPVANLKDGFNLNMLTVNDAEVGANDIFDKDAEGQIRGLTGGACEVKFTATVLDGNKFRFINLSKVNLDDCPTITAFEWDFGDGTPKVTNGKFQNFEEHTFAGTYPYTVTLKILCGECAGQTFSVVITGANPCSSMNTVHLNSTIITGGVDVMFTPTDLLPGDVAIIDFGDGSATATLTSTGLTHSYPLSADIATYTVVLTVTRAGCPTPIVITQPISLSCGHFFDKDVKSVPKVVAGRIWQLSGAIWVQNNLFTREMGSSSQTYRFGKQEVLKYAKNATSISTDIYGIVVNYDAFKVTCTDVPITSAPRILLNDSYVDRRPPVKDFPNGPRFEDGQLKSYHKAFIGTDPFPMEFEIILVK